MADMSAWWTVPGPDGGVLELRRVAQPEPGLEEVLVAVRAAGVNRGELIARPALRSDNPRARPTPSGIEFAGEIAALGESTVGWSIGDRVMGRAAACHAEQTLVAARALVAMPAGTSFEEAAAIPNVFVTAHDALITAARTEAGQSVLVTSGSSGVGTAAIQIAKHLGATPILATTRSPAKAEALHRRHIPDPHGRGGTAVQRPVRGRPVTGVRDRGAATSARSHLPARRPTGSSRVHAH